MNRNNLITVAALGLLAYFLLRKKKQPAKELGQAPDAKTSAQNNAPVIAGVDAGTTAQTTATLKAQGFRLPKKRLIEVADLQKPAKRPIFIAPQNVIPDVYDRGVGKPVMEYAGSGERYYNMSGTCSENVQNACRCAEKSTTQYKLDIPTLP